MPAANVEVEAIYEDVEPMPDESSKEAFAIMASDSTYAGHDYGQPTSVTATEDSITVTMTAAANGGKHGFTFTASAVQALLDLGYTKVQFTFTSDAPYFVAWSSGRSAIEIFNSAEAATISSGDVYFASGSVVIIDLQKAAQAAASLSGDVAFKLCCTSELAFTSYQAEEVNMVFSNFVFTKAE